LDADERGKIRVFRVHPRPEWFAETSVISLISGGQFKRSGMVVVPIPALV
jgi:hypothetical protein